MTTVNDVLQYLWTLAPEYMKEEWDNVGLMVGSRSGQVQRVMVALDPFYSVCEEAQARGADLLVTHHPMFFHPAKSISDDDECGRAVQLLVRAGIANIAMHTNLDAAPDGVNDRLAERLGLRETVPLVEAGTDERGRPYGIGRIGQTDACTLAAFLQRVKQSLGCEGLRFCDGGRPVRRVAVGGGACAEFFALAARRGCDTFVTSDVRYNQFQDAKQAGISMIDAGHFWTEDPVCAYLLEKLRGQFPHLTVFLSEKHTDVIKFG